MVAIIFPIMRTHWSLGEMLQRNKEPEGEERCTR